MSRLVALSTIICPEVILCHSLLKKGLSVVSRDLFPLLTICCIRRDSKHRVTRLLLRISQCVWQVLKLSALFLNYTPGLHPCVDLQPMVVAYSLTISVYRWMAPRPTSLSVSNSVSIRSHLKYSSCHDQL